MCFIGEVPRWLSGRLIRNGPGLFEIGDTKYNHPFDGLALLHSFTINEGKHYLPKFVSNLPGLFPQARCRIEVVS